MPRVGFVSLGCLGARAALVRDAHPEVLAVTGPHAYQEAMEAVHRHLPRPHEPFVSLLPPEGVKLTPGHHAYFKISEGCNHRCSFCLDAAQLDRVGCFAYSPVAGAAANALSGAVPEEIKEERLERFMARQAEISRAKLAARVGQRMTVLVDAVEQEQVLTRSYADAPEIDGNVIIPGSWELEPGDFVEVEVTGASEHDLWGAPVGEEGATS
jgi:tRNA A37 methylthiotransferase MiaB